MEKPNFCEFAALFVIVVFAAWLGASLAAWTASDRVVRVQIENMPPVRVQMPKYPIMVKLHKAPEVEEMAP